MNNHFISVITVAYNSEALLSKAFDGIASQSYKDFEYIFVDNGSTDKTGTLIDEFIISHPEIDIKKFRIDVNEGLSMGRNAGLALATGNYVFFHDADDWMDSDCLESLSCVAHNSHASRIIQQVRYVNEEGILIDESSYSSNPSGWLKITLQGDLYNREIISANCISFDKEVFYDDVYFSCLFSSYASDTEFLRETHYNMLIHSKSITHKESAKPGYFLPLLEKTFIKMQFISDGLRDKNDYDIYEYGIMELYYGLIFHGKDLSYIQKVKEYDRYKEIMHRFFPRYLKNKNVKLFAENGFYGHFKRNIWICFQLEKVDGFFHVSLLMYIILFVYHIAYKTNLYKSYN